MVITANTVRASSKPRQIIEYHTENLVTTSPTKNLTLPLQHGGTLPSVVGSKNQNTILRDQIEMEFCDPLHRTVVSNRLLS
jgi:hypothetical protein